MGSHPTTKIKIVSMDNHHSFWFKNLSSKLIFAPSVFLIMSLGILPSMSYKGDDDLLHLSGRRIFGSPPISKGQSVIRDNQCTCTPGMSNNGIVPISNRFDDLSAPLSSPVYHSQSSGLSVPLEQRIYSSVKSEKPQVRFGFPIGGRRISSLKLPNRRKWKLFGGYGKKRPKTHAKKRGTNTDSQFSMEVLIDNSRNQDSDEHSTGTEEETRRMIADYEDSSQQLLSDYDI